MPPERSTTSQPFRLALQLRIEHPGISHSQHLLTDWKRRSLPILSIFSHSALRPIRSGGGSITELALFPTRADRYTWPRGDALTRTMMHIWFRIVIHNTGRGRDKHAHDPHYSDYFTWTSTTKQNVRRNSNDVFKTL